MQTSGAHKSKRYNNEWGGTRSNVPRKFLLAGAAQVALSNGARISSERGLMVFGHNSNVKVGGHTFHVQTEDRGSNHAMIDTTVYFQGRVLHRRTNNYLDLLPLTEDSRQALKARVDEQHQAVMEAIRNGELQLTIPPGMMGGTKPTAAQTPVAVEPQPRRLIVELANGRSWLAGKQATLHVLVKEEGGGPLSGAKVSAEIEGSGEPAHSARTGEDGQATISFEMPKLTGNETALVIRTENGASGAQLRFALRTKPRVPTV